MTPESPWLSLEGHGEVATAFVDECCDRHRTARLAVAAERFFGDSITVIMLTRACGTIDGVHPLEAMAVRRGVTAAMVVECQPFYFDPMAVAKILC